jgi:hypothetical protein
MTAIGSFTFQWIFSLLPAKLAKRVFFRDAGDLEPEARHSN